MAKQKAIALVLAAVLTAPMSFAQSVQTGRAPATPAGQAEGVETQRQIRPNYVLGVNDQIMIRAFEVEEISDKPFRIDQDGTVNLPLVGKVKLAGLSVTDAEQELVKQLKRYVREPQVTISIVQFRSEPVFFVGAFKSPGIYTLQNGRTLLEMMTAVGGLQPNSSRRIRIERRLENGVIPLPNAVVDEARKISRAEINLASLQQSINPAEDLVLQPYDVLNVDRAEMVYVSGGLARSGGFELGERDSMSVTQVVSLSGGWSPGAKPKQALILRPVMDTTRRAAIPVDLTQVFSGQANDIPLQANDVLFVPPPQPSNTGRLWMYLSPLATAAATSLIWIGMGR